MLLEAMNSRDEMTLEELATSCYEAGKEGVIYINKMLEK